jgi:hypothetical protein
VPKKIIKKVQKGQQRYILRIRGGGTPESGVIKLGTFFDAQDFINHAKFYVHQMNGVRAWRGSKNSFPFEMHKALTTLPCASALASEKEGKLGLHCVR